jgi:dihydroorotate dehydrogenase electron transfer subunit
MTMRGTLVRPVEEQSDGHYLISIKTDGTQVLPGQFVSLRINDKYDPFLRRPFSVFDFSDGVIDVLFQEVGKGTSMLARYKESFIDIIAPLGKGFTLVENKKVLLIGGGAGNAPLYYLSRLLKERGCTVTQIYGSRTSTLIYCKDKFCSSCDEVIFMTDDGSEGEKGFVTHAAQRLLAERTFDMIYVCGPDPMLRGLVPLIEQSNIRCEVSLENYFGCGTGICYGCTIRTKEGNRRVCNDGPVFPFDLLDFNLL